MKKRILVSISDPRTYDNYALFTGSVLHTLASRGDVEVLALIGHKIKEKLSYELPNLTVIYVEHDPRLNRLQRIAQFLYSYLLYTDTTYLVSSFGARADRPRTRLQDLSAPFKRLYYKTVGQSDFVRNYIAPRLYLLVFRRRPYKKYFDEFKPDIAFLPNMCRWPADVELLAESKRQHVSTVGIPRNWDHMSKYFIPFKVDTLCAWSHDVKREALEYQGYQDERVVVTGSPQVDFMVQDGLTKSRAEFLDFLGFPAQAKVVLFASQGPYALDAVDHVDIMMRAYERGEFPEDTYFIVRPYPGIEFDIERLRPYATHDRVFFDSLDHVDDRSSFMHLSNVLKHSDVAVTSYSSIFADSTIFDTPCVVTNFDGYQDPRPDHQTIRRYQIFTHVQTVMKTNGTWYASSAADLVQAINQYLKDPSLHSEGRAEIIDLVFGHTDGKNSERVVAVIDAALKLK